MLSLLEEDMVGDDDISCQRGNEISPNPVPVVGSTVNAPPGGTYVILLCEVILETSAEIRRGEECTPNNRQTGSYDVDIRHQPSAPHHHQRSSSWILDCEL